MPRLPHIAILGRPNVGKSTLFNRLIGRRQAIVDPTPGITRDRLEGEFTWEGRNYRISDLAGWNEDPANPFAGETLAQIERTAQEADVLILLVDGKDGPTEWDRTLIEKLRASPAPLVLVVNKCDSVQAFDRAHPFWELGVGEPLPISATHNLNIDELLDRIADLTEGFDTDEDEEPETAGITVAILGHQNTGKSTLFNALVGDHRAIVSDIPGTTRDAVDTSVDIEGSRYVFVDTAGLKKPTRVKEPVDFYASRRAERALARCSVALFLVDCTEGVSDTDLKIAGLIQKAQRACILVASKWDESEDAPGHRRKFEEHLRARLHFLSHAPVRFTSGLHEQGIEELLPLIRTVYEQYTKRVPTAAWNQALGDAVEFRPPPTVRGKRLKFNYVTQFGTAPPRLALFVNQPEFLRDQYKRYLEKFFRERFGFEGAPLVIRVRRKRARKGSPVP